MKHRTNTNPHIIDFILKRNGFFPNNGLPVLLYRKAMTLPDQKNKAATIAQKILNRNGWSNSWRNGIYDFHHYHSNTHECLIVCAGHANVVLGGPNGKRVSVQKGDVMILPAGVGHRCTLKSEDFLVAGAYPQGMNYDMNMGTGEEYKKAVKEVRKVPIPKHDPVFGDQGFLKGYWKYL